MYRVLIVDDEEPVLNSFSYVINTQSKDFQICGLARSGEEAIELMKDRQPDLVFMDVHMPGIDGIDTIIQLKTRYPQTVFILATAYERFDIARRVIPLNVFGYLLKPITKHKLLSELERTKNHLDQLANSADARILENQILKESSKEKVARFLGSLRHRAPDEQEWQRFKALTDFSGSSAVLAIAQMRSLPAGQDLEAEVLESIARSVQYKVSCVQTQSGKQCIFLFPENEGSTRPRKVLEDLRSEYEGYDFALGNLVESGFFHQEYKRLYRALKKDQALPLGAEMKTFVEKILHAPRSQCQVYYDQYWQQCFAELPFEIAKGRLVGFYSLLMALGGAGSFDPAEAIVPLEDEEAWMDWSSAHFTLVLQEIEEASPAQLPQALRHALAYMKKHYSMALDLEDLAEECKLSPSYLSRLFSNHLGMGFVEYLHQLRVEAAQKLLEKPGYRIKEIARMVGFKDPNYFSRVYRRIVGMPPTAAGGRT